MAQDDPNFPRWAQNLVIGVVVVAVCAGVGIVGFVLLAIGSWIGSGSH